MSQLADELMRKYLARERAANRPKSPSAGERKTQRFLSEHPNVARIVTVPTPATPKPKPGHAKRSLALFEKIPHLKNIKIGQ